MSAVIAKSALAAPDRYRAAFEERWRTVDALTTLRRAALDEFLATGFPTQRDEEWKYTSLRRLESRTFTPAPASAAADAQQDQWIADAGARIVFIDGHWSPALSSGVVHPSGLTISPLGRWSQRDPSALASRIAQQTPAQTSALERLNLAFFEDGLIIELADGAEANEPIYIVHQCSSQAQGRMTHPRMLLRTGRNSRCTIIEQYLGPANVEYFTNAVTLLDLDEGAVVNHYRVQQESTRAFHIGRTEVRQRAMSRYTQHDVALGGALGRTDLTARLEGAGAHVSLHGLFAPEGSQHLDAHTHIDHIAAHTTSDENYRGVASGRGRGVFNGKVIVRAGAQKIDARQSSRNLLLSPTAEIDAKPELEIYADDVKCSHGATIGQLDATALFYLRSRGLAESDARALLIRAFAESILISMEHAPLRAYLEAHLNARFSISSGVQS